MTVGDLLGSAIVIAATIGLLILLKPRGVDRGCPPISPRSMRALAERMNTERHQHPGRDS